MAGGIQERDQTSLLFNLVRADMLGNTTGFAGSDFGLTNGIQEAGLAVIDMTEDGDYRRAGL